MEPDLRLEERRLGGGGGCSGGREGVGGGGEEVGKVRNPIIISFTTLFYHFFVKFG